MTTSRTRISFPEGPASGISMVSKVSGQYGQHSGKTRWHRRDHRQTITDRLVFIFRHQRVHVVVRHHFCPGMTSIKIHFRMKHSGGLRITGTSERFQHVSALGINLLADIVDGTRLRDVEAANTQLPRPVMRHMLGQIVSRRRGEQ